MSALQKTLARARRRLMLQQFITALGASLLAGMAAGVTLLLLRRLLAVHVPWWVGGLIGAAVVIVAAGAAWRGRCSDEVVAAQLDHRLGLKDRLSTALFARSLGEVNPFARQVIDDGEKAAAAATVKNAAPVRFGRVWGWVGPAAALVALLWVFVPGQLDLPGPHQRRQHTQATRQNAHAAQNKIVQAKTLVEESRRDETNPDDAGPARVMKDLATLTNRDLSNPAMKKKTVAQLSDVRDKLNHAARSKKKAFQSMQNRMSRLDPGAHGPADRFADALRRGDFPAAQQELKTLQQQIAAGSMSDSDKNLLHKQLKHMQRQLGQTSKKAAQQAARTQKKIARQLQKQGLNQSQVQKLQKQKFRKQPVQKALQKRYQQQGMNQAQAKQKARQQATHTQQKQQQSRQSQSQSQMTGGLDNALGQMASSLAPQSEAGTRGKPAKGQPSQSKQTSQTQSGQQSNQGQRGRGRRAERQGQGQSGGGRKSRFAQGAWQAQQQLNQMARMRRELQKFNDAQNQLQQAMQNLEQHKQNNSGGGGQQRGGGQRGGKGKQWGTAQGGNPIGPERRTGPYQTRRAGDIKQGEGRVIASWREKGENNAGPAKVDFNRAVTEARDEANRAVAEDRVPRRYHRAIHDYFNQLPTSPGG